MSASTNAPQAHSSSSVSSPWSITWGAAMLGELMDSKDDTEAATRLSYANEMNRFRNLSLSGKAIVDVTVIAYDVVTMRVKHFARIFISLLYTAEHLARGAIRALSAITTLDLQGLFKDGLFKTSGVFVQDIIVTLGHVLSVFAPEVIYYSMQACREALAVEYKGKLDDNHLKTIGIYRQDDKLASDASSRVQTTDEERAKSLLGTRTQYTRPWVEAKKQLDLLNPTIGTAPVSADQAQESSFETVAVVEVAVPWNAYNGPSADSSALKRGGEGGADLAASSSRGTGKGRFKAFDGEDDDL